MRSLSPTAPDRADGHLPVLPRHRRQRRRDVGRARGARGRVRTPARLGPRPRAHPRGAGRAHPGPGTVVLQASGTDAGQSVPHLHFHVVPCWSDDGTTHRPARRSARVVDGTRTRRSRRCPTSTVRRCHPAGARRSSSEPIPAPARSAVIGAHTTKGPTCPEPPRPS
ncbi:HIT domain-containing protein [Curtobacterium sp. ER1/6]|uniref:HIT family protein n=1 Tax=Curtobacterium sp. ER1/6 TaxID=1891920 RepID=UPI0016715E94